MPKQIPTRLQLHDKIREFDLDSNWLIKIFDMLYNLCEKEDSSFFSFPFSVGNNLAEYATDYHEYNDFTEIHIIMFKCTTLMVMSKKDIFDAYIDNHLDDFLSSIILKHTHMSDLMHLITRKPSISSRLDWKVHINQESDDFEIYYSCVKHINDLEDITIYFALKSCTRNGKEDIVIRLVNDIKAHPKFLSYTRHKLTEESDTFKKDIFEPYIEYTGGCPCCSADDDYEITVRTEENNISTQKCLEYIHANIMI